MSEQSVNEMQAGYEAAAERIELEIGIPIGSVVDIGCSDGSGMEALQKRWPSSTLYGIEPDGLRVSQAWWKKMDVRKGKGEFLPFSPNTIDLVFSRHSLEHVEKRGVAINEMYRVLKMGGHVYIQVPIEPNGTKNKLHLSPFTSLEEVRGAMSMLFKEVYWGPQATVTEFIGVKE